MHCRDFLPPPKKKKIIMLLIWSHPSHPEWVFSGTQGVMIATVLSHDAIFPSKCNLFFKCCKELCPNASATSQDFLPPVWEREHLPLKKIKSGASLVAQWLRICLQGTRVRALVWEDPTCRGATGPVSHNYWACASGGCAPQQERPRQWEARALRWRVAPARCN